MRLYSDAPITGAAFDALGSAAIARRLVDLVALPGPTQPLVIGLTGPAGRGKTTVLHLAAERLADRPEARTLALDAWTALDAAHVADAFSTELADLFAAEGVVGGAEKVRDRLVSVGDIVSSVIRLAGVKVDVKGALERSPDKLREEVLKLTQALDKRIVVFVDHLDRLPAREVVGILQFVERWGAFPYFAFVVALEPARLADGLRRAEYDPAALERILTVELALPPIDRAAIAAWVRPAIAELADSLRVDPAPALALFAQPDGAGLDAIPTLRVAKRLINALVAAGSPDLAAGCRRFLAL